MASRLIGKLVVFAVIIAVAGVAWLALRDTAPPEISLDPAGGAVSSRPIRVMVRDAGSGVRKIVISAAGQGGPVTVFSKDYPAGAKDVKESFTLSQAGLKDGRFSLTVAALDHRAIGENRAEKSFTFTFDTEPPKITVKTIAHNINQGGAGLIVYAVSEDAPKSGVAVGERFFHGYRQASGDYYCLFVFPWDSTLSGYSPRVVADDAAGNSGEAGFGFLPKPKAFKRDTISLSDKFLNEKMPQFQRSFPDVKSPVDLFLKANRDLRRDNAKTLLELGMKTDTKPLWRGSFFRMDGTATMAGFADTRSYMYNGGKIDEQTHLGFDLASSEHAPVPAANDGKVVLAGFFGIYGECVVIDHGLGLQSLYGHLSRIDVKPGDSVKRGQTIGLSGATGMAGGDHLHFGMMLSGWPVNPLEWFDEHWIKDNVTGKMAGI
ncbi:MAG: peptidoglycan DD-metalloendopeptidase family protein [Nitrospirae bacterium]|nr:peptidoglycan DD-metalloendopeptidase family protein [Nitrospirota bacterium]